MPQIPIQKCQSLETTPQGFTERLLATTDSIRERAFSLFQKRSPRSGSDLDDWLQAERDVVWSPASELVDEAKEFKARIAVPGFDAKDLRVSAMPDALLIEADASHTHEGTTGKVCFCEFSEKKLFRRLPLPGSVDVNKVTAFLDKGILEVTAPKATPSRMVAGA